ncbi:MAG: MoaD/ThiS family protein [Myxococcales bacterium]|nr:MoaD/ThiS family protein [Myxococcales bacterium]
MTVRVEFTYEMSKKLGVRVIDVDAKTVADVVDASRQRFGDETEAFEQLASRAALAVNGVLVRHRKRLKTQLDDGDRVTFVKAAAGG